MRRLVMVVIAIAMTAFGCLQGTTTPGVKRCFHTFVLVGWYNECEEGPPWTPVTPQPPQPRAAAVSTPQPPPKPNRFCFWKVPKEQTSSTMTCVLTEDECRRLRSTVDEKVWDVTIECEAH